MGLWKSRIWLTERTHTLGTKLSLFFSKFQPPLPPKYSQQSLLLSHFETISKDSVPFQMILDLLSHIALSLILWVRQSSPIDQTLPRLLCLRPLGTESGLKFIFPFLPPDPQVTSTHCSSAHVPTSESWGITWVSHVKAFKWVEMLILGLPKLMIAPFLG